MRRKAGHRFLSILLSVLMIFSALPAVSYAQESDFTPVDTELYYGRSELAKLNKGNAYVKAYDKIKAGLENFSTNISLTGYNLTKKELSDVFYTVINDNPQIFWAKMNYKFSYSGEKVSTVLPVYVITKDELSEAKKKYSQAVSQILEGVTPEMSDFEIECYLHDSICRISEYMEGSIYSHVSYGALVKGMAVCEGYTRALQDLLLRCGIEAYSVPGTSYYPGSDVQGNHIWLIVKIGGEWYHLDPTWDDHGDNIYHVYFNLTTEQILEDHMIYKEAVPVPLCTSEEYGRAYYFTQAGRYITEYDSEAIKQAFVNGGGSTSFYYDGTETLNDFYNRIGRDSAGIMAALGWDSTMNSQATYVGNEIFITLSNNSTDEADPAEAKATKNQKIISGIKKTEIRLKATVGKGYIKLTWERYGNYKVDKYIIYKSIKKASGYNRLTTTTKRTFKDTKKLTKGKKYYYKVRGVRAVNGNNVFTEYSNIVYKTAK